jgi:hypothetical protein
MHVRKVNRIKLDNKSTKCIFIGYSEGAKGYKFWIMSKHWHTHSENVIFKDEKYCEDQREEFVLVEKVQHVVIPDL